MQAILLQVERREERGQGYARRLRRQGRIPGVYYGRGTSGVPVAVSRKEFTTKLGGIVGTHLIQLVAPGSELDGKPVILKEVQVHPVTSEVLHADFYAIDPTRRLRVHVPLRFEGKAVGVTAGGVLQPLRRELTLECLPTAIPAAIVVDVTGLGIHDSIHVQDLTLPEGTTAVVDTDVAVVTVVPPTVEAAPAAAEAAPVAEGAAAPAAAPAAAEKPAAAGTGAPRG
jgi:large subunit ribosomal protein L25